MILEGIAKGDIVAVQQPVQRRGMQRAALDASENELNPVIAGGAGRAVVGLIFGGLAGHLKRGTAGQTVESGAQEEPQMYASLLVPIDAQCVATGIASGGGRGKFLGGVNNLPLRPKGGAIEKQQQTRACSWHLLVGGLPQDAAPRRPAIRGLWILRQFGLSVTQDYPRPAMNRRVFVNCGAYCTANEDLTFNRIPRAKKNPACAGFSNE